MKKTHFIILLFTFILPMRLISQTVDEEYDRLTTTHILVLYNDESYNNDIESIFTRMERSPKFDIHQVNTQVIYLPTRAKYAVDDEKRNYIINALQEKQIPRAIIEKWYNRTSDGNMDLKLIHKRGKYNADDYEFLEAQLKKRGDAAIKDYGNKLINKSYIIVSEIYDIENARNYKNVKAHGYSCKNITYTYKLDFNEAVRQNIYDSWIYPDDSELVRQDKIYLFNNIEFNLIPISQHYEDLNYTQSDENRNNPFYIYKSDNELFTEMIYASYTKPMDYLSSSFEEFKVKTFIDKKHPLQAKIGKKEGVYTDQKYFVYEHEWSDKLNKAVPVRKAVIRANNIAENRRVTAGDSPSTTFYQTAGWNIQEGMLIQEHNDLGVSFATGWEAGVMGGFSLRLDYRTGFITGIPALYIFGDINFSSKNYEIGGNSDRNLIFTKYSFGVAKGFNFAYHFEVIPFIAYGVEHAVSSNNIRLDDNDYSKLRTSIFKYGVGLSMNIVHNVQLFSIYSIVNPIGDVTADKDTKLNRKWKSIFEDRYGATRLYGLRILF